MQNREKENKLIAERIRRVRKGLGLYQEQFAKKIGFDQTTISKWEQGKARPTPDALVQLAWYAEGIDKLFFLEHAGLPPQYLGGNKMIPEIKEASTRVVARALNPPSGSEHVDFDWGSSESKIITQERKENESLDPELLAQVWEAVESAINKTGIVLPRSKYAEIIAGVYDEWRKTGQNKAAIVERLIGHAYGPSDGKVKA